MFLVWSWGFNKIWKIRALKILKNNKVEEGQNFEILRIIYQRKFCIFSAATSTLMLNIWILPGNFIPAVNVSNFNLKGSLLLNLEVHLRSQSKKKPNIWNSASVSRRRMLATVVLCSGDFKLYFHTSHITSLQLVIELRGLEWTCV